jgi:DNA (cytosine-5)-methyltransferase 1
MIRILNLYAGIGGNRKLWSGDIEVTAVEINSEIAKIYQDFFSQDKIVIGDAHQFLLEHYEEFDFIWSSPPCPTHSRFNLPLDKKRYPDMALYQEIIFLKCFFKKPFVVENVISYYKPLIEPYQYDGHFFWSNFFIGNNNIERGFTNMSLQQIAKERDIDLDYLKSQAKNYELLLNNCVLPQTGLKIFNLAFKEKQLLIGQSEVEP